VDRVHGRWTMARSRSPPWTGGDADGRMTGHSGVLARVGLPATLEHGSTPARAQKREGSVGKTGSGLTGAQAAV
jgi:hypothetical protein